MKSEKKTVKNQQSLSGKTSRVYSQVKTMPLEHFLDCFAVKTVSYNHQGKDGRTLVMCMAQAAKSLGESWMLNISECHSAAVESSLYQLLEKTSIPEQYYLSKKACDGILRRAENRGKVLPDLLKMALEQASSHIGDGFTMGSASGENYIPTLMANASTKLWTGNQEVFSGDYHIVSLAPQYDVDLFSVDHLDSFVFAPKIAKTLTTKVRHDVQMEDSIVGAYPMLSYHAYDDKDISATLTSSGGVTPGGGECFIVHGAKNQCVAIPGNIIGGRNTAGGNGQGFDDSGVCYTLTSTDKHAVAMCVPINSMVALGRPSDDLKPRMGLGVGDDGGVQNTITANHHHWVAYQTFCGTQNDYCRDVAENVSPTLRSGNGGGAVVPIVNQYQEAYSTQSAAIGRDGSNDEVRSLYMDNKTPTLTCADRHAVAYHLTVRRLMPIECERLQGFPDNWTAIPYKKKDASNCPDGPRYKAMGNSMAVPVMRWIGERLQDYMEL